MSEPADVPALPIQAAFRGHRDRTQLEAKRSWMADVAQGDALTPRALGDVNGETGSRPRALLGVDASAARNDARSRAAASRAAKAGTRESSEAHSKTLGKNARSQPPTRGQVRAGAKAPGAQKAELAATKQLREFFDKLVVSPMVERAAKEGEAMLAARRRQREWEQRPLSKPVFSASLFVSLPTRSDSASSLAFVPEGGGTCVVCGTQELPVLQLGGTSLEALRLAPLVKTAPAKLPTMAPLQSVCCDAGSGCVSALHTDGMLLVWGARNGELRHATKAIEPEAAAAMPPPARPLLTADCRSGHLLLDCTWLDGSVRLLEPTTGDEVGRTPLTPPGAAPGMVQAAQLLYLQHLELLLVSFERAPQVLGFDAAEGELRVELSGHAGEPPLLRHVEALDLVATGGRGTPEAPDFTVRLWRLRAGDAGEAALLGEAETLPPLNVVCERVLVGHAGPLTDVIFLPRARLLVTAGLDCSIRFWDPTATPHLLTAPEGGAHVRVSAGVFAPMAPEWTLTNPAYVNCLLLQTEDPPVSLALASGSSTPESLLALCVRPELEAPAGLEVKDLQGGSLGLWGVTRNTAEVEAWRFDEPLGKEEYMKLEASAAAAWREEMTRIKRKGGKGKGGDEQEDRAERAQQRIMELLRQAVLQRGPAGLDAPLQLHALREAFEEALMHARHVEEEKVRRGRKQPDTGRGDELRSQLQQMLLTERAAARPRSAWEREPPRKGEGGAGESSSHWREIQPPPGALDEEAPPEAPLVTTLSQAQAFNMLSSHKLLGGKLSKATDLRTWLSELLDFKPARPAFAGQQDPPASSSALAPAPALARKGRSEVIDEAVFVRLLNDVDPLARLRDSAGKLAALVGQLAAKVPKPRGAARLTAERHLKSWRAKCQQLDEQLSSIAACVRAHAGVLVARQLRALLPAPARPPSQPQPQARPGQAKLPALTIERTTPLVEWDEPPRAVYAATDLDGAGDGVARRLCVAVLTVPRAGGFGAAGGQKATASSTPAEHAALELSVAKLLAGSAGSFFSRCLGSINHPPTLMSPDPELHIVYEYLAHQRGAHGLVQAHGPLRSAPLTCVIRSWGRQLLLALEAAHRQRLLLRTLRLRHLTISPDGQRLKLGPSALANVALTDGSAQGGGGGGKLLVANDLPPLDGPLTREMVAAADTADADAAPSAAPTQTPQAKLDEEVLAPELLLPAVCAQADVPLPLPPGAAPVLASGATAAGGAASTPAYPPLTAACDVWLFGRMLFELHFGEAPDSFSASVARHWHECGQAAHSGLQQLVPETLSPLPPAGQPTDYSDSAPPSHHYDPFTRLTPPAPKAAAAQAAGGPRGAGDGVEPGQAETQIAQRKRALVDLAPAARLPSRARSWLPSAERGDTHSEPAPPLLLDLIGACLQPRPSARPSVAALLGSPFFSLDVGAILTAKRNAAAYLATPKPAAIVQRDVAAPLLEAQRAAALSGRLPARLYEQALQAALACSTRPRRVLRAGGVQEGADRQSAAEELAALGPPDADELQACAALVAEVVATCDAFSCLRKLALEEFGAAHGQGLQMTKVEPRAASVLELGRALRMLLTHADLDDSYLAPHIPALLAQLFELWSGDARLHSPEATLAGAPPATPPAAANAANATKAAAAKAAHVGTSAAAAAEKAHAKSATPAATTAGERAAATKAAAPPASAAAPPPAWPDKAAAAAAMSDGSLVSKLAQSAPADGGGTRYLSWVQPSVGLLEDWQVYCEEGVGHWSVSLWRLLHPIVSGVLSEEGGGSLAMPALRDVIRRQGAPAPPAPLLPPPPSSVVATRSSAGGGGTEEVDSPPPMAADVVPLLFENFHPVSSKPTPRLDSRGARPPPPPPPPRPLSRDHCAELLNVQGSLQRLTDPGRRARATALSHLSGVLRTAGRAHGAVLCAELGVPRHASALLSDPEAEVRESALRFFLQLAQLHAQPAPAGSAAATAQAALLGAFGQQALMRSLAAALHDNTELTTARKLAVQVMVELVVWGDDAALKAMQRADAWPALIKMAPLSYIAQSVHAPGKQRHEKVDYGARAVLERVAHDGTPQVLTYFAARPGVLPKLRDLGLHMPRPATLAELGALAYAVLAADGVGARGLPSPELAVMERAAQLGGSAAAGLVVMMATAAVETAVDGGLAAARAATHASDAADDPEATDGGRDEAQLVRHAAAALRLPYSGMPSATRGALLSLLALARRRATRALRAMQTHAERAASQAAIKVGKRGALAGTLTNPDQLALENTAEAAARATDALREAFGLMHELWPLPGGEELLLRSGAAELVLTTALEPLPRATPAATAAPAAGLSKEEVVDPGVDPSGVAEMIEVPPLLIDEAELPLVRARRMALELLFRHMLPSRGAGAALVERLALGGAAVAWLHREQEELAVALTLPELPALFTREYAARRETRLATWRALLDAPRGVHAQLQRAGAVETLVVVGALPHTRSFPDARERMAASFVAHNASMALRLEGLEMLRALLLRGARCDGLLVQLQEALRRNGTVEREVALLRTEGGRPPKGEGKQRQLASAVLLLSLLEQASHLHLWQLLQEAGAVEVVHALHLSEPDAAPLAADRLLVGFGRIERPLGRAAAGFLHGMRDYEHATRRPHPLLTDAVRGGPPPFATTEAD